MKTLKSNLPNILTLLNLFSGIIALFFVFKHQWDMVFWFVVLGILFDFFDGLLARSLGVSGEMGLQLDSLADMVTSGLVPSFVMFFLIEKSLDLKVFDNFSWDIEHFLPFAAVLVALASAWRLAKFNIDTRQTVSFIGLPTPANALMILSIPFLIRENNEISRIFQHPYFLIFFSFLSAYLLNMEVSLFSLKFKDFSWKNNWNKFLLLIFSLVILLIFGKSGLFFIIVFYVILSILTKSDSIEITH